jgi:hypothetical protein
VPQVDWLGKKALTVGGAGTTFVYNCLQPYLLQIK